MPSSRQAPSTPLVSMSRLNGEYSICITSILATCIDIQVVRLVHEELRLILTLAARRSVASDTSDRPRYLNLPSFRSSSIALTVTSIGLSSFQPMRRVSKAAYLRLIVYSVLIITVNGGKVQSLEGFFKRLSDVSWVAPHAIGEFSRLSIEVAAFEMRCQC
jgi:hypothetical protein